MGPATEGHSKPQDMQSNESPCTCLSSLIPQSAGKTDHAQAAALQHLTGMCTSTVPSSDVWKYGNHARPVVTEGGNLYLNVTVVVGWDCVSVELWLQMGPLSTPQKSWHCQQTIWPCGCSHGMLYFFNSVSYSGKFDIVIKRSYDKKELKNWKEIEVRVSTITIKIYICTSNIFCASVRKCHNSLPKGYLWGKKYNKCVFWFCNKNNCQTFSLIYDEFITSCCCCSSWWGETMSLSCSLQMIWVWRAMVDDNDRKNQRTQRRTCPIATLTMTNPT
jgi:hypothetical protein